MKTKICEVHKNPKTQDWLLLFPDGRKFKGTFSDVVKIFLQVEEKLKPEPSFIAEDIE